MINLLAVGRACGRHQPAGGGRYLCACPVPTHGRGRGDKSPSLSIGVGGNGALIVKCFAGCDPLDVLAELRRRGLDDKRDRWDLSRRPGAAVVALAPPFDAAAAGLALWRQGVDPRGTLTDRYLASRRLDLGEDLAGGVLRWHPGIGALLALFRSIESNRPQAICRTFIDGKGRKIKRMFVGPVGGAAIKLDADENVTNGLHVGEGLESCMAARQLGLRPTWALGSSGAVAAFPVIGGIQALSLLREHDEASERACEAAATRWATAGREVFVIDPIDGNDMADVIVRGWNEQR